MQGLESQEREPASMRRPFPDYDFVDFVTFMICASAFVVWIYMEMSA